MGFTNVAWESRSTEQLARDLTDGPGPTSVGQAGAAWVRIADEWASISEEYDKIVEKIKGLDPGRTELVELVSYYCFILFLIVVFDICLSIQSDTITV